MIQRERLTCTLEGDFVVFLIGMRLNKPWKLHRWLPLTPAMPRMLAELEARPELGVLGGQMGFGRITIRPGGEPLMDSAASRRPSTTPVPARSAHTSRAIAQT